MLAPDCCPEILHDLCSPDSASTRGPALPGSATSFPSSWIFARLETNHRTRVTKNSPAPRPYVFLISTTPSTRLFLRITRVPETRSNAFIVSSWKTLGN